MVDIAGYRHLAGRAGVLTVPLSNTLAFFVVLALAFGLGILRDPRLMGDLVYGGNAACLTLAIMAVILASQGIWSANFVSGVILVASSMDLYLFLFHVLLNFQVDEYVTYLVFAVFVAQAFLAAIMGIGVGRVLGILGTNLSITMYALVGWLFSDLKYVQYQFVQYSAITAGSSLLMYYYRTFLIRLIKMRHESLGRMEKMREQAERWGEENRPYIEFGRNTAGLIHDFRNFIHVLGTNTQVQMLRMNKGSGLDGGALDDMQLKLDELKDRIGLVDLAATVSGDDQVETFNVGDLVRSILYPFTISREIRLSIKFESRVPNHYMFTSIPGHVNRILDNLVRNSCEALMDQIGPMTDSQSIDFRGNISLTAYPEGGGCTFVVCDTGPGIPHCNGCGKIQNCMECSQFHVGKTTKSYGSGWGMVNVRERIHELGGRLAIQASSGLGTSIKVWLPAMRLPRRLAIESEAGN